MGHRDCFPIHSNDIHHHVFFTASLWATTAEAERSEAEADEASAPSNPFPSWTQAKTMKREQAEKTCLYVIDTAVMMKITVTCAQSDRAKRWKEVPNKSVIGLVAPSQYSDRTTKDSISVFSVN